MKEKIKRPLIVSTLSTLVAVGITSLVYVRKVKQDKPLPLNPNGKKQIVTNKPLKEREAIKDVYRDDNDLGYC